MSVRSSRVSTAMLLMARASDGMNTDFRFCIGSAVRRVQPVAGKSP